MFRFVAAFLFCTVLMVAVYAVADLVSRELGLEPRLTSVHLVAAFLLGATLSYLYGWRRERRIEGRERASRGE